MGEAVLNEDILGILWYYRQAGYAIPGTQVGTRAKQVGGPGALELP